MMLNHETFLARDGLTLALRRIGAGHPVVCVPGGPGRDAEYLGDLGGLAAEAGRQLVIFEPRGTGRSGVPEDRGSYRCDRMTGDLEALREYLELDRMDLLAHSAGADLALLYAARYPERTGRLALITPSLRTLGLGETSDEEFLASLAIRSGEPWYPQARAAVEAMMAGDGSAEAADLIRPFLYGRWDQAARDHDAASARNPEAARGFGEPAGWAEAGWDRDRVTAVLGKPAGPVLVYAAELDRGPTPEQAAAVTLFPGARLVVQPGAAHFPWVDDPAAFATAVAAFLR